MKVDDTQCHLKVERGRYSAYQESKNQGQRDGSVNKGDCYQVRGPEFYPWADLVEGEKLCTYTLCQPQSLNK